MVLIYDAAASRLAHIQAPTGLTKGNTRRNVIPAASSAALETRAYDPWLRDLQALMSIRSQGSSPVRSTHLH